MSTENTSFMDKLMSKVDVIAGPMTKFGQIPFIKAVVNGMVGSIGVTMVGSIFLIIYLLCFDGGLTETALLPFMKPWAGDLALINSLSMGMMAVYIVIAMGAEYAEIKGFNKTTGAVGAFFAFILLNYNAVGKLFIGVVQGSSQQWLQVQLRSMSFIYAISIIFVSNYQIQFHLQSLIVSQRLFLISLLRLFVGVLEQLED